MAETVGDHVLARLREWGVEQVFGYPGDGINGLIVGVRRRPTTSRGSSSPATRRCRRSRPSGYAKFSGRLGVCMATSGPGRDPPAQRPLRRQARPRAGRRDRRADRAQRDGRLLPAGGRPAGAASRTWRSEYLVEVNVAEQLPNALDRAFRTALTRRAPTARDHPQRPAERAVRARRSTRSSRCRRARPAAAAADAAARRGRGRARRRDPQRRANASPSSSARAPAARRTEVAQVADVLGAGVAKALLGKDVLPDDLPFVTGSIGLLGTRPSYELMRDCDTLLIVGSNFPYSQFLPEYGKARAVQIDVDGTLIGMRYPTELNIVADAGATLRALLPLPGAALRPVVAGDGREERRRLVGRRSSGRACVDADPVNPMRIVWEMSQVLPDDAIVTADSGSVGQLVRQGAADAARDARLAVRHARHDGRGGAVRDRRQVRPPGPAGRRADGRRRHADERDGRAADDRPLPRPLGRPAADRLRAAQQRPQPGHLGAARDGRRAEVRGVAGAARRLLRRLRARRSA